MLDIVVEQRNRFRQQIRILQKVMCVCVCVCVCVCLNVCVWEVYLLSLPHLSPQ